MSDQIEVYAPKPGSIPWRVVKHLQESGAAELSKREIGRQFGVDNLDTITTLLQLACARGVLVRGRNSQADLTWKLGDVQCVLATTRPVEETPAARDQEPAAAPTSAVGKWSPSAPRALPAAAPAPVVKPTPEPIDEAVTAAAKSMESMEAAFAEVFGEAAEIKQPERVEVESEAPVAVVATPVPEIATAAPAPQRKQKRGTAPAKPRPAAKPYLAEIRAQPLNDPARREAERYVDWLGNFDVGHSAIFRLADMKAVEGAVSAFAARTRTRFRIAKVSQYRAGIERTA